MPKRRHWFGLDDPTCERPDVAVIGLPWDGAASRRAGAALAPARLRELSTTSDPITRHGVPIEGITLRDFGDVRPPDPDATAGPTQAARTYLDRARARLDAIPRDAFRILIGGDNSVGIAGLASFADRHGPESGVIWFDAHPDLFDRYDGNPDSHACALRRGLALSGLAASRVVLIATRSMSLEERRFIDREGIGMITAAECIASGAEAVAARCAARLPGATAVYLAVDIDGFDASCAPGTGYPMPGGPGAEAGFRMMERLFEALPIRGMDLTEIAPPLDTNDMTGLLGCQVVIETLGALASKRG